MTFPTEIELSIALGKPPGSGPGSCLVLLVAGPVVPQGLVALWRYRNTIRRYGVKSIVAAAPALVFRLAPRSPLFHPRLLTRGRLDRLLAGSPAAEPA